jgi:transposase
VRRRDWRSGYCIDMARGYGKSRGRRGARATRFDLRDESAARYKPVPPRATKLDPFRDYVVDRLKSAAPEWIPASVLLRDLRERGYTGGYTMLKGLVASLKPKGAAVPIVRF